MSDHEIICECDECQLDYPDQQPRENRIVRVPNWAMLPLVITIRVPIMLTLQALVWVGRRADDAQDVINPYLPALTREFKGSKK